MTKLLLDELALGRRADAQKVAISIAALSILGVIGSSLLSLQTYLAAIQERAIRRAIADRLFERVSKFPGLAEVEDPTFRDRLALAEQAGDRAPQLANGVGPHILGAILSIAGFAAVLTAVWPPMIPIVLASAVPGAALQLRVSQDHASLALSLTPTIRRQFFFRSLLTSLQAAKEIRLFGLGQFFHERLMRDFRSANRAENAMSLRRFRLDAGLNAVSSIVSAVGIVAATLQAMAGHLSVGDVAAFLAAVGGVQAAVISVTTATADGYGALILFGAYHEIVSSGESQSKRSVSPVPPLKTSIEFRDVWFRYQDASPWVLRGITFEIRAGETIGVVGLNGAGKSTIVKLLCGMYEPQRGAILWNGVDLRDADPAQLRARISAVFQDYMEYDLTAAENIALGDLALIDDRASIEASAAHAGAHAELTRLPRGYDTMLSRIFVSESGSDDGASTLSGGQWQRIALARGLLRNGADLLILDEPSAALDAEAEHALYGRLRGSRAGRTRLLISHRLGALRDADRIVVLRDGTVAENGTHDQLLTGEGEYARLFLLQASAFGEALGHEGKSSTAATQSSDDLGRHAKESSAAVPPGVV